MRASGGDARVDEAEIIKKGERTVLYPKTPHGETGLNSSDVKSNREENEEIETEERERDLREASTCLGKTVYWFIIISRCVVGLVSPLIPIMNLVLIMALTTLSIFMRGVDILYSLNCGIAVAFMVFLSYLFFSFLTFYINKKYPSFIPRERFVLISRKPIPLDVSCMTMLNMLLLVVCASVYAVLQSNCQQQLCLDIASVITGSTTHRDAPSGRLLIATGEIEYEHSLAIWTYDDDDDDDDSDDTLTLSESTHWFPDIFADAITFNQSTRDAWAEAWPANKSRVAVTMLPYCDLVKPFPDPIEEDSEMTNFDFRKGEQDWSVLPLINYLLVTGSNSWTDLDDPTNDTLSAEGFLDIWMYQYNTLARLFSGHSADILQAILVSTEAPSFVHPQDDDDCYAWDLIFYDELGMVHWKQESLEWKRYDELEAFRDKNEWTWAGTDDDLYQYSCWCECQLDHLPVHHEMPDLISLGWDGITFVTDEESEQLFNVTLLDNNTLRYFLPRAFDIPDFGERPYLSESFIQWDPTTK